MIQQYVSGNHSATLSLGGHTGNVVRWEQTTDGGTTWTMITNTTTTQVYTDLTATTEYRAVVQNGVCSVLNSATATVQVDGPVSAGSISSDATVCSGNNGATLQLSNNTDSIISWLSSTDGNTWSPVANTSDTLSYTNLTQTTYYRVEVRNGVCGVDTTTAVTITVDGATVAGTVGNDTTVCAGSHAGTLTLSGHTGTVQSWEQSTNGGTSWSTINNATTTQAYTNLTTTTLYRAVVQNGTCAAANATAAAVQVDGPVSAGSISSDATVCSGNNGATLQLSNNTDSIISWLSSTDGNTWSPVANTSDTLSYTNLTQTTYYRVEVRNGVCGVDTAAAVTITVDAATVAGTVGNDTAVCSGNHNAILTLSGHTGSIINWEQSTDGGTSWATINNATTTQAYTNLTETTLYRAVVQSGACAAANATAATVQVDGPVSAGSISSDATVCSGNNGATLQLSNNTDSIISWLSSTDGNAWSPVANTSDTLSYTNLTQTTYYRVEVRNGVCGVDTAAAVTITVDAATVAGTVGNDTTVCSGNHNGTLTLSGHTGSIQSWEQSIDNGTSWSTINNTTTSQAYTDLTQSTQYRAVVKNGTCAAANATAATVTINGPLSAGSISGATTVCRGSNSGTLQLANNTDTIISWLTSTNDTNWTATATTTSAFTYNDLTQTTYYRVEVRNGVCGADTTASVEVTVDDTTTAGTLNGSTSVCSGSNSGAITLVGTIGTIQYWQQSIDGGISWSTISNTTASQAYNNLTQSRKYRAVVQNGTCTAATSDIATVSVDGPLAAGSISSDATVCAGSNGATLQLSGNTDTIVSWLSSTDGATWTPIANTTDTLSYSNLTQSTQYRVEVSNGVCGVDTTVAVTITVESTTTAGTLTSADTSVCYGSNTGSISLAGHTGSVQNWEQSIDNGTNWTTINNTSTTQAFVNLTQGAQYRAIVQNGTCAAQTTNTITVNVDPLAVAGSIDGSATVCSGANGDTLVIENYAGSIVSWLSSTNGSSWSTLANTTDTLSYVNSTASAWYKAIVGSGVCADDTTDAVYIQVDTNAVGGALTADTTVCAGTNSGTIDLTGNTGAVLSWEYSVDGQSSWSTIVNQSTTHNYADLDQETYYRVLVDNGVCLEVYSSVTKVNVDAVSDAGVLNGAATVCADINSGTVLLTDQVGSIVKWQSSDDAGSMWANVASTSDSLNYLNLAVENWYRVIVKNGVCGADTSLPIVISIASDPVADAGTAIEVSLGYGGTLNGSGSGSYEWSPGASLSDSTIAMPTASPTETTTYTLTVTDSYGCQATDTVSVIITIDYEFKISNFISPNGDGKNDVWYIENIENYTADVVVVNAYGKQVYQSTAYANDWGGDDNGTPLPDGTYYYVMKLNGGDTVFKGAITILNGKN